MPAIGAIDLGMCVVGEDEPQGKANRRQQNAGGNSDYDPRKVPLVAIAGTVRRSVVVHTESIPPVAALRLPPNAGWGTPHAPFIGDHRKIVGGSRWDLP